MPREIGQPPEPIVVYGAVGCDDTERTRAWLQARGVPFREVTIDDDSAAEAFVRFVNGGQRSTPTLVIGTRYKTVIAEPSDAELAYLVAQAGY